MNSQDFPSYANFKLSKGFHIFLLEGEEFLEERERERAYVKRKQTRGSDARGHSGQDNIYTK